MASIDHELFLFFSLVHFLLVFFNPHICIKTIKLGSSYLPVMLAWVLAVLLPESVPQRLSFLEARSHKCSETDSHCSGLLCIKYAVSAIAQGVTNSW